MNTHAKSKTPNIPCDRIVLLCSVFFTLIGCSGSESSFTGGANPTTSAQDESGILQDGSVAPQTPSGTFDETSFLLTNNESTVYKVSPTTGEAEILYSFDGDFEFKAPADVIGNIAYMTADDNTINALDVVSGRFLWDVPIGEYQSPRFSEFPTAVVCDQSTCWARGSTGVLMAINASNGRTIWSTALHPNGDSNEELNGSELLVTQDKIYLSAHKAPTTFDEDFVNPALFVINRDTGAILNKIDLEYSGFGVPRLIGNTLIVSTWGEILAFDATGYELLWRINDPALAYTRVQIVENVVVAGVYDDNDHYVTGFDLATGSQLWSVAAGSSDNAYSSTTDGQLIYAMVGDIDTSTFFTPGGDAAMAIDPRNGNIVWINERASFVSNPLVAFGKAFYGYYWGIRDDDFNDVPDGLTGMNASTGELEWVNSRLDTPGLDWFTTTPMLVHDGMVYRSSHFPDVMP